MVHKTYKSYHIFQVTKKSSKKYGILPTKEPEVKPWEFLCVHMIGPYSIKRKDKRTLEFWCVTMIDPVTCWFDIKDATDTKQTNIVTNVVEQAWLNRYPWPQKVISDRGTEFMTEFSTMVQDDYGIKKKPITKINP